MKKIIMFVTVALFASGPAFGYDANLAQQLDKFYQPFHGSSCAKELQMIKPEAFVKDLRGGKKVFVLDVRTKAEADIVGVTVPGTVRVPLAQVFTPETLSKIPTDGKVVVTCKAGHRATAVAMGLRQIGFENVYILKGGLDALTKYIGPKSVH